MTLAREIKEFGLDLGYSKVGITSAEPFTEYAEELRSRGAMYDFYLTAPRPPLLHADPRAAAPFAQSIIVLVWDYGKTRFPDALVGKVGRIYQARCYNPPAHHPNAARFQQMQDFLKRKGCRVSTEALLPDRWAAARAGVASFGKNNFVYAEGCGSFISLSSIIIDKELEYDEPTVESKCPANCRACLDACPSRAIYAPFKLNPRRCLAFNAWKNIHDEKLGLTDSIPREMRPFMGEQIHGCDLCQEACPRNQARLKAKLPDDAFLQLIARDFSLTELLHLSDDFYESRVRPIMYNYIKEKRFFQRNAAVAIGNIGDPAHIADLRREMDNPEEVVREHVAWALGRIGGPEARKVLEEQLPRETSAPVREEIRLALAEPACV